MTAIISSESPSDIERLINFAIASAASCIEHGIILQTIDWKLVDRQKVSLMLEGLKEDGTLLPQWLARALLIGGHILPAVCLKRCDPELCVLNGINSIGKDKSMLQFVETAVADLEVQSDVDTEVAIAIIEGLATKGFGSLATKIALRYWRYVPQTMRFIKEGLAAHLSSLHRVRLRLLSFSTTSIIAQDLLPAFAGFGVNAHVTEGGFGEVIQDLLAPKKLDADALLIVLDLAGFYTPNWRLSPDKVFDNLQEKLDVFSVALESFSKNEGLPVLINTLPVTVSPSVGFIDGQHQSGEARSIESINQRLNNLVRNHSNIVLVDSNVVLSTIAPIHRWDPKLWFYGRLPYSADATRALANGFALAWRNFKNGPAKVLALDLDNTLWGGIYGEDGIEKLTCNDDFPGNAFKAFQQECLRLKTQGMLLTILSKNNPDALQVFELHPDMLLRKDDFVAREINWGTKSTNICRIAKELNLGLDSFIFIDDSPHEREAMRRLRPEVEVPELPNDPARRPRWLRELSTTWPIRLTEEDSRRSDMYVAEQKANHLRHESICFEDYLRGLKQQLTVGQITPITLTRVAQMHMRTNQFNLTTQRFDETDIKMMMADQENFLVLHGRVEDKFGDHGIVICAAVQLYGEKAQLLSFLMSCRVIGRQIEQAFLGEILKFIVEHGVKQVEGTFIPTHKNGIARDFYDRSGFSGHELDDGKTVWEWKWTEVGVPTSDFIKISWNT